MISINDKYSATRLGKTAGVVYKQISNGWFTNKVVITSWRCRVEGTTRSRRVIDGQLRRVVQKHPLERNALADGLTGSFGSWHFLFRVVFPNNKKKIVTIRRSGSGIERMRTILTRRITSNRSSDATAHNFQGNGAGFV